MRFKGLDLNLLVALDILLAERSVTQASERLHLTQSAVSCALARLRETLGDELLVQSGKKMLLTPFAEELRSQVREILTLIDATMLSNPGFQPETSERHFRIACSDFVAEVVMIVAQREVSHRAPGISLDLLPIVSDDLLRSLERGDIDLVIAPEFYCHPTHAQAMLFTDTWACLAWADNQAVGATLGLEQYLAMDHVTLQPFEQVALDQRYFDEKKMQRRVKVTAPIFALIPRMLVGTKRIATVPSQLAATYDKIFPLKSVRLEFDIPPLVETLQWHPSRQRDVGLAWLRDIIHSVARSTG